MATKLGVILADFRTSLATKLSIGAATCSIQSATDDDSVALPTGKYYLTIDGDNSQKEHIYCTLTGTSLTDIKSVSRQGVQTANAVREHRVGASVVITDFAHILELNNLLSGTTDLNGAEPLAYDTDPDLTGNNKKLATVKLVEDTAMAGGADASTTVKGITKLSVAPASATEPIAVGTNDNRVSPVNLSTLTAGKIDALAGTSGTPSSTNKYVTNDDTATSGAGKVLRLDGSGNLPVLDGSALTNVNITNQYVAAENITAGEPVSSGYYQADGGITFDAKVEKHGTVGAAGGTITQSFTVGNHTNRVLIVGLNYDYNISVITSVTFNGVSLTKITDVETAGSATISLWALFAPAVTTANIVITATSSGSTESYSMVAYSYYNVVQSVHAFDEMADASGNISLTLTPTVEGALIFSVMGDDSTETIASLVNIGNNQTVNTTNKSLTAGDTGFIYPKKATTISGDTVNNAAIVSIALAPITTPSFGYVFKTNASALANACNLDKANNFIGFASESKNLGETIRIQTGGVKSGLTNLVPFAPYYIANTAGQISPSAGTISKKVGKAISTTDLLIQHDN